VGKKAMGERATILWLEEITQDDRETVGGKGANLGEMTRAGYPVPPGFCVTTDTYLDFIRRNDLEEVIASLGALAREGDEAALEREAARLKALIAGGELVRSIRDEIAAAYAQLLEMEALEGQVAVRSSAIAEDLTSASFAGQQETYLYVSGTENLLAAVKSCWASLWSSRAISYRRSFWADQETGAMAVVVQAMIPCNVAGVAFSADPLAGQDRVIIEASWGLGEAVVRGEVEADRYVVERTSDGGSPQFSVSPGHKARQRTQNPEGDGGTILVNVPAERRDALTLSSEQVRRLAETVLALEKHFGAPQDVEWGFWRGELYIFQTRPLTVRGASWFTDSIVGDDCLWTSGFLNERFSEPVSPLGWTMARELLEELAFREPLRYMGYPRADSLAVTKLYRGHPFVNGTVFQILYKPFPDFFLPEDAYRYFPGGDTSLRKKAGYPPSIFAPRLLFSLLRAFLRDPWNWSTWHNYRQWARFTVEHQREMAVITGQIRQLKEASRGASLGRSQIAPAGPSLHSGWKFAIQRPGGGLQIRHEQTGDPSLEALWWVIEQAQELNKRLLALHRWSLTHADLTYTLLRKLAVAWLGQEQGTELCAALVSGLPNKSLELDRELQKLAEVPPEEYEAALAAFLAQYGHRSFSLDIYRPTFAADPAQVTNLKSQISNLKSPISDLEDGARQREAAYSVVRKVVVKGLMGRLKMAVFDHVLGLARRYMPLREDQRFYWQESLAAMREIFLLIGDRLLTEGLLEHRGQVFFATKDELEVYVKGRGGFPVYEVQGREREFRQLQSEHELAPHLTYPAFLIGNRPLDASEEGKQMLVGRPVSPGLKRGPVKVVSTPRQFSKVQAGDIMVTRSTDPGWTPLFGLLGGLIMESGGQLSHGAVVAREYGLPAVAGIAGATQLLHDGQVVVLDGLSGMVTVID
jgi:phosphohistidine swiveling domain-containing protein